MRIPICYVFLGEAIWSNNTGHMAQTLNIDLLEEDEEVSMLSDKRSHSIFLNWH